MIANITAITKLFKKCKIIDNNPIFRDCFLVFKKKGLYCINIENKSIRKVMTHICIYDVEIKYSSDGKYFIIINNSDTIYVYDANSLDLIQTFIITNNIEGPPEDVYNIDLSKIEKFVVYNEFLICSINYMREAYRRYEEGYININNGIEVYNIITGNLVKNVFNITVNNLILTENKIYCKIEDNPDILYQLTPELELTQMFNNINRTKSTFFFNKDIISFSFVNNNDESFLYISIGTNNSINKTKINLNFKLPSASRIYHIIYTPNYNYLLVGLRMNDFTRVLFFSGNNYKYLFYIDIDTLNKFYILDDYRIVYNSKSNVIVLESPLTKVSHAIKECHLESNYFLPDELWNKVISSF